LSLENLNPLLQTVGTIAIIIVFWSVEYVPKPILSFNLYAYLVRVDHSEISYINRDIIKKSALTVLSIRCLTSS